MNFFKNKVVWITGASSGIGEALAIALAARGARLVLSARRTEELERVRGRCGQASDILLIPFDLEKTDGVELLVKKAIESYGRVDILISNGGISQRSWVHETPMEVDRRLMEVNYFGSIALTKAVLPYMIGQKSGHIAVVSSIAGKFGYYMRSAYSAAKHALHGFYESLRMEVYEHNIFVTMVCPGKVKTHISIHALTASGSKHGKMDEGQANGVEADICAEKILEGIEKNKFEIFIGGPELKAIRVKRLFPNLFYKLIRKQKPR